MFQRTQENTVAQYKHWASYLLGLKRYAKGGNDLIGLGEVVAFFESAAEEIIDVSAEELDDLEVEIDFSVTISAELLQGEGRLLVYLELSDQAFELGEISYDYDSFSRVMYTANPCFEIDYQNQYDWRDLFEEVLGQGKLRVCRNHV
jgi:hypothetical protein